MFHFVRSRIARCDFRSRARFRSRFSHSESFIFEEVVVVAGEVVSEGDVDAILTNGDASSGIHVRATQWLVVIDGRKSELGSGYGIAGLPGISGAKLRAKSWGEETRRRLSDPRSLGTGVRDVHGMD